MKKILLTVFAVSLLSTSAMAEWFEGKIGRVNTLFNNRIIVEIKLDDGTVSPFRPILLTMGPVAKKQMLATILTAKVANMPVRMFLQSSPSGTFWDRIILK